MTKPLLQKQNPYLLTGLRGVTGKAGSGLQMNPGLNFLPAGVPWTGCMDKLPEIPRVPRRVRAARGSRHEHTPAGLPSLLGLLNPPYEPGSHIPCFLPVDFWTLRHGSWAPPPPPTPIPGVLRVGVRGVTWAEPPWPLSAGCCSVKP